MALPQITHAELPMFMEAAFASDENILFVSPPGCGKTVGIKAFAQQNDYELILSHPAVWEPTDAKGLPARSKMYIEEKVKKVIDDDLDFEEMLAEMEKESDYTVVKKEVECATFLPFDDLLKVLTATKPTIWFFDDLGQAVPLVQAALMQYLEGGELEGRKIPDCIKICAASNDRTHKAGVKGLLTAVRRRFGLIMELVPDVGSTTQFFLEKGYPIAVTDYLNARTGALLDFKPNTGMENTPCPALWEKLAKFLSKVPEKSWHSPAVKKLCSGCVGQATGDEFHAFLAIYTNLPSYDDIVSEPAEYPINQRPDERFAILGMLANKAKKGHAKEIFIWIDKLKSEYQIYFVRICHALDNELVETMAMRNWTATNANVYTQALSSNSWANL